MKQLLFTIMLFVVALSPLAAVCQALPNLPSPRSDAAPAQQTPPPDPAWARIEQLAHGEPIVVTSTIGPPVHCRFAGATDAFLFCDPAGNPAGTGYRFDRADVLQVDLDRWQPAPANGQDHDSHRGLLIAAGLVGIGMGAIEARGQGGGATAGVAVGLISAGFVGIVGMVHSAVTVAFAGGNHAALGHRVRVHRRAPASAPLFVALRR
jgi:hypothetical protein